MGMGFGDTHRAVCYGDGRVRRERSELKRDWETTTIDSATFDRSGWSPDISRLYCPFGIV
jgi:hypothetical protein